METAEEWAAYLGTTVLTEEEYPQRWNDHDRQVGFHRRTPGMRSGSSMTLTGKTPAEVDAFVEERRGMGEGILGVLPPYTGPDDDAPPRDYPVWRRWDWHRTSRRNVGLVLVEPDPHPQLDDLSAVTFTPEVAIAQMKEHPRFLPGARLVGPEVEVKAALMTMPEAYELIEHQTPPGKLGIVPGRLVTVVVIHGLFEVASRPRPHFSKNGEHPPTPAPPEVTEFYLFHVCDSRKGGGGFWQGSNRKGQKIILPEQ